MVKLPNGTEYPKFGIGTWHLGDSQESCQQEKETIQYALQQGVTLIDTAEMYGNGNSEKLVGDAIQNFDRESLKLVSKVLPQNASKHKMRKSLEASLKRLRTDYLDLYLLHWIGQVPLQETIEAFEELKAEGKIKAWGISNFDLEEVESLRNKVQGDQNQVNQVLYHLGSRGIEVALKPYMDDIGMPVIAYCPMGQGGKLNASLQHNETIQSIAKKHRVSEMQVILAWILHQENTIAIPRTGNLKHMQENIAAQDIKLTSEELDRLDQAFPVPTKRVPLDIE